MTTFNSLNISILKILNILKKLNIWKIVIVSNKKNIDHFWKNIGFENELVYLSIKDQKCLGYNIIRYLNLNHNSFTKKNIGYLYAIQHGAKEIYEIDEDIIISDLNHLALEFTKSFICYGLRNDSKMINPYDYFGETNIWPRGFRIKDIGNNGDNKYYILNSSQLTIKPLIFQGLINGIPDVDSIFIQTRIEKKKLININFSSKYPLLYLPGNYIPINSKNTRYLYEIFPYLFLSGSLNERLSDIFRGFIMQYFAWNINGALIYYSTSIYNNNYQYEEINKFIEEKDLFYNLDNLLTELNAKLNSKYKHSSYMLFNLIEILFEKGFLSKKDVIQYEAFIKDLLILGYDFSSNISEEIFYKNKNDFYKYSEFKYYLPNNQNIILNNNKNIKMIKLINHYRSNKTFTDILLIINYKNGQLKKFKEYIFNLYYPFFPNIVFITPIDIIKKDEINIISCNESLNRDYSYICFKKVYEQFPKYKGYLFINVDILIKIWELQNFDFNIPWFFIISPIVYTWINNRNCFKNINKNLYWKNNLTNIFSFYDTSISSFDFFYIPNFLANKFLDIIEIMYNSSLSFECALSISIGIFLYSKYQIINVGLFKKKKLENLIKYLKTNYIAIYPINFSNNFFIEEINKYIFFINAKEY